MPGNVRVFRPCHIVVAIGIFAVGTSYAEEPPRGEFAAAIRSADYPCNHVKEVTSAGDNIWIVQCNSGRFRVTRDSEGNFLVSKRTDTAD
ncbi:MAG: hypothetical protein JSU95_01775 [Betaproteobacteria bacterium]|nr:MAG: hypothetical protein JSU95_01775 [Betaproteobacteria bacterium]